MNRATSLRAEILSEEIPHAFFEAHLQELRLRIKDAIAGNAPFSDMVIGPSRVGKSMLIGALAREFPEFVKDGVRQVPVLVVPIPTPASPKELPRSVLKALVGPQKAARMSTVAWFDRMAFQLKLAGVVVILFDEASHIVDVGTKLPPRAAGDWFKQLMDMPNISIVLFGVPRLERLLESNEQLRYRSGSVLRFNPYEWSKELDQNAFFSCIKTYVTIFDEFGHHFEFGLAQLVQNCYFLSGGLVGIVAKFMHRLATDLIGRDTQAISLEHCASSASRIATVCELHDPAFKELTVADVKLQAAYLRVLNDASVRYRKND